MITKCVSRQELMKLWTWQGKGFSLTKGILDSRKYSAFYKDNSEAFEKLWRKLGTCQIVWCYHTKEEATFKNLKNDYKGKVLWELDVPEKHILKRGNICSVAWHWILTRNKGADNICDIPQMFKKWFRIAKTKRRECEKGFHDGWKNKTTEELWDALFLDDIVRDCSQLLVPYPVEDTWTDDDKCELWENVTFIPKTY